MKKSTSFWNRFASGMGLRKYAEDAGEAVQQAGASMAVARNLSPVGSSGTEIYSGYFDEEYLDALKGSKAAEVYDKMERSDANVAMCLGAVKNPLRSCSWEVVPGDDTPEAKEDAEFVSHLLFSDMDKPWGESLEEILDFIAKGHSVFEIVHKIVLEHPKWGSYVGLKHLGFRSQRTIERWNLNKETEQLESVTQYAYGDLDRQVDIPGKYLVVFTVNKRGANYEGISLLRPCYGPYFRKGVYQKLVAIGIEKYAIPIPKLKVPANKFSGTEYDNAIAALQAFTSHQSNYLTFPEGWELDTIQTQFDPQKVQVSIDAENKEMVFAFLANFLTLGQGGGGGAYALGKDLSDFFLGGIEYLGSVITGRVNQVIKDLVIMNRGPRGTYPRLEPSGISDKAGKELGELLKMFVDGRMLTPDDQLEKHLRKRLKLPEMSLEGQRSAPPAAPGFGGPTPPGAPAPEPGKNPAPTPEETQKAENDLLEADPENLDEKQLSERSRLLAESPQKTIRTFRDEASELMQERLTSMGEDLASDLAAKASKLPPAQRMKARDAVSVKGKLLYKRELLELLARAGAQGLEGARLAVPKKKTLRLAEQRFGGGSTMLDEFDTLPRNVQLLLESQADLIVESQIADLQKAIYFQFASSLGSTDSWAIIEHDLVLKAQAFATGAAIGTAAGNVISLIVNESRNTFFREPEVFDEIEAFEFVNPDPDSPICKDLAGRVFAKDDPEAQRYYPPLHHNCESILVPILKGSRRSQPIDARGLKPSDPALEKAITLSEAQRCCSGTHGTA